jgi:plastocyanin
VTRRLGAVAALVAAAGLWACAPARGDGPPPTLPPGGVGIVAENLEFTTARLEVPAGTSFGLLFENREGAPHNVRIYDEGAPDPLFVGEVFAGPASRLYQVLALAPGVHRFRCDVHPAMTGEIVAG